MSGMGVFDGCYEASRAAALAGVPVSTVYDWARKRIVTPSLSYTRPKLWSYADLMTFRIVYSLRHPNPDPSGVDESGPSDPDPGGPGFVPPGLMNPGLMNPDPRGLNPDPPGLMNPAPQSGPPGLVNPDLQIGRAHV